MSRHLVEQDGLFLGSSSAVNLVAAFKTARRVPIGSTIVTILCDSGSRHYSKFHNVRILRRFMHVHLNTKLNKTAGRLLERGGHPHHIGNLFAMTLGNMDFVMALFVRLLVAASNLASIHLGHFKLLQKSFNAVHCLFKMIHRGTCT